MHGEYSLWEFLVGKTGLIMVVVKVKVAAMNVFLWCFLNLIITFNKHEHMHTKWSFTSHLIPIPPHLRTERIKWNEHTVPGSKKESKQHITKCFSCKTPLVQSVFFSSMNVSSRQLHINNMLLWTFQLHRLWGFTEYRPTFWLWAALNTHSSYDREPLEI